MWLCGPQCKRGGGKSAGDAARRLWAGSEHAGEMLQCGRRVLGNLGMLVRCRTRRPCTASRMQMLVLVRTAQRLGMAVHGVREASGCKVCRGGRTLRSPPRCPARCPARARDAPPIADVSHGCSRCTQRAAQAKTHLLQHPARALGTECADPAEHLHPAARVSSVISQLRIPPVARENEAHPAWFWTRATTLRRRFPA